MRLHNESRRLLVEEYEKTHDAKRLAETFQIRLWTVYHIVEKAKKNGTSDLQTIHNHRPSKLKESDIDNIRQCVDQQPDITLHEIVEKLNLTVSIETVRRALVKMGYTYKKKNLHAKEQERPRCGRASESMENRAKKN